MQSRQYNFACLYFQLNCWCDQAMIALAGQALDNKQTLEGMRHMLKELEDFFIVDSKMPVITGYTSTGIEVRLVFF